MPHTPLIAADAVPTGKAVRVRANDQCLIVCNDKGTFYVADCVCPHAGGPLGGADVSDGCVVCPVHHWPWDLQTGLTDKNLPGMRLAVYPCEVREGVVHADLSGKRPPPPAHPDLDCHSA